MEHGPRAAPRHTRRRVGQEAARAFYAGLLDMTRAPKPPKLAVRGGCWFSSGPAMRAPPHRGAFGRLRRKAIAAFVVTNLAVRLRVRLESGGLRRRRRGRHPGRAALPHLRPVRQPARIPTGRYQFAHADELLDRLALARGAGRARPARTRTADHGDYLSRAPPTRCSGSAPDLLVRLPRQPGGSAMIEKEARWLPLRRTGAGGGVPEIVAVGAPGSGYPEPGRSSAGSTGSTRRCRRRGDTARRSPATWRTSVAALRASPVPPEALADPPALVPRRAARRAGRRDPGSPRRLPRSCPISTWTSTPANASGRAAMALPGAGDLRAALAARRPARREPPRPRRPAGRGARLRRPRGSATRPSTWRVAWEVLDPAGRDVFRTRLGVDEPTWLRARGLGAGPVRDDVPVLLAHHACRAVCAARRSRSLRRRVSPTPSAGQCRPSWPRPSSRVLLRVFFAAVFFAAVFFAGAFLAALRGAFFAGPRARRSASSSAARSSVSSSTASPLRSDALVSPSVT